MLVPSVNPRGAARFLQALREAEQLQIGGPGDGDQQVQRGEDLLTRLTDLATRFPAHQARACQQALLELKLCKPEQALVTGLPFVKEGEVGAARWAVHLAANIYWLEGHLVQVHALAYLSSCWLQHRCRCFVYHTSNLQKCAMHGPFSVVHSVFIHAWQLISLVSPQRISPGSHTR